MLRKLDLKILSRRKALRTLVVLFLICIHMWYVSSWFKITGFTPQQNLPPNELALRHYQRFRNLSYYLDEIQILIEPTTASCPEFFAQLLILVASTPENFIHREAVRRTWGRFLPTLFVLGLDVDYKGDQLADNREEAREYDDLIVFDLLDHEQTLTLKTALMMEWTLSHCQQVQFMMRTEDGVLINPPVLKKMLREHKGAKLIVKYLKEILRKANQVTLNDLESIYFTYKVAHRGLGFALQHDWRISPKKPWLNVACAYRDRALTHGYTPDELVEAWLKLQSLSFDDQSMCDLFKPIFNSKLILY